MKQFFVMGDRQMKDIGRELVSDPEFGGFITESSDYLDCERCPLSALSSKFIDFARFLRHSQKHGATLVLFYNEIGGSRFFFKHLKEIQSKYNFELIDFISFCIKNNYQISYQGAADRRNMILEKKRDWISLADKMSDEFSKNSVLNYIEAMETLNFEVMKPYVVPFLMEAFNKFSNRFSFVPKDDEIYIDVGAFDGDTVVKFIEATPTGGYRAIHAFEPNPRSFTRLEQKRAWIPNLSLHRYAASNFNGNLTFYNDDGGMGARIVDGSQAGNKFVLEVKAIQIDELIDDATLMKFDVEGFETEALQGATNLIKKSKPSLVVDTYHYANDALKIYDQVMSTHDYKYVGMRFAHAHLHTHSLYFSDDKSLI
ncbi:MAG: FkbM family methyltransferase [Methylovirgula sp.]